MTVMKSRNEHDDSDIAIIGIACRFPGAKNWREFWNNLINGVESIRTLSEKSWKSWVPTKGC